MALPKDPFILLSWVNTQLRDRDCTLCALCEDEGADEGEVRSALEKVDYHYDPKQNRFV